jgi:hypothetical protein
MFKIFDTELNEELNVRGLGFSKKFELIAVMADTQDGETTYAYDFFGRDDKHKDVIVRPWDQFEPRFKLARLLKEQAEKK